MHRFPVHLCHVRLEISSSLYHAGDAERLRRRPPRQHLSTAASSWLAGLMTTEAEARQRYSPAEVVAPIPKNSRDHLLDLILISRNDVCSTPRMKKYLGYAERV
jgi:hypothetical protein